MVRCAVAAGVVLVALAVVLRVVAATDETERAGYYMPVKAPRGFTDVRWIELVDPRFGPPNARKGMVRIGSEDRWQDFRFRTLSVKGDDIIFTTVSVNGVRFSFRGRFIATPRPIEKDSDRGRIILVGTLTRNGPGTTVAESKLQFAYTPGD